MINENIQRGTKEKPHNKKNINHGGGKQQRGEKIQEDESWIDDARSPPNTKTMAVSKQNYNPNNIRQKHSIKKKQKTDPNAPHADQKQSIQ